MQSEVLADDPTTVDYFHDLFVNKQVIEDTKKELFPGG
jgi:hypothetical protein